MSTTLGHGRDEDPISFAERLIGSQQFRNLFREGMSLVEETASYLDGAGRSQSRLLSRAASLGYATESMRLTTRLMQIASWLLIHRAVAENEMSVAQARDEKRKVRLTAVGTTLSEETYAELPEMLRELVHRSERLQERVMLLDRQISDEVAAQPEEGRNPVASRLDLLRAAFVPPRQ